MSGTTGIASALARLDDAADQELFELMPAAKQCELEREFVHEYLDDDDRETAVFTVIDEHDGKDRFDASARLDRLWREFLNSKDLRSTYSGELEEAVRGQHEGDEDGDQFNADFAG